MRNLLFILILLISITFNTKAQDAYLINDFSDSYDILHIIKDKNRNDSPECFLLLSKKDSKELLAYGDTELLKYAQNTSIDADYIKYENMYQKNIIHGDDYNFDGIADIIIYDPDTEDEGCYNPIQYANIFISQPDGTFKYNKALSEKCNDANCLRGGYFYANNITKEICTESSGGAAEHYSEYYKINADTLLLIRTKDESGFSNPQYMTTTIKSLENGKWEKKTLWYFKTQIPTPILSFDTKNGKGRVFLYLDYFYIDEKTKKEFLYYVFMQQDETITFAYPESPEKATKNRFKLRSKNGEDALEFNSGTVKYTIYQSIEKTGIRILVNGEEHDWQADTETILGDLSQISKIKLDNVNFE